MKAMILDAEALRAISPAALAAYARGEGWIRTEAYGAHADVYEALGKPEIILPRTARLNDFPTVVSTLVGIFAKAAGQDELATYRDLIGVDRDVIRVRSFGGDDDGSVFLDAGVKIVSQSQYMLLAAACAARTPQSLYRAGANREASDYMRRVKLGQTEHGSFVVTLLAPVPPLLQPQLDPSWVGFEDEPFERQVTRRLMGALEASRNAAELAAAGEGARAFENAVNAGVSANLCEAIAGLVEQSNGLDISLTWARTRPTPEAQRKIGFSVNDAEILKEAARVFRSRHPQADVSLIGTVSKLKRDQDQINGLVTFKAVVDEKLQSVNGVLDQANYEIASRANVDRKQIIIRGDLERVSQRWQLTNGSITELSEDDEVEDQDTVE
jgi:hypothetical protein